MPRKLEGFYSMLNQLIGESALRHIYVISRDLLRLQTVVRLFHLSVTAGLKMVQPKISSHQHPVSTDEGLEDD